MVLSFFWAFLVLFPSLRKAEVRLKFLYVMSHQSMNSGFQRHTRFADTSHLHEDRLGKLQPVYSNVADGQPKKKFGNS